MTYGERADLTARHIFNIENTEDMGVSDWFVVYNAIELQGKEIIAFWDEMNFDPDARVKVESYLKQNGYIPGKEKTI